jgi:hypothetical protein
VLVTLANDPIARQYDSLQQFLEGYYGIEKEYQEQFLMQISNIPKSIARATQYDTTSRLVKAELKGKPETAKSPLVILGKVKSAVIEQQLLHSIKIEDEETPKKRPSSVFSKLGW